MFLFPDIEADLRAWLPGALTPTYGRALPTVLPGRGQSPLTGTTIRVLRVGGVRKTPATDAARVYVEVTAADAAEAQRLMQIIRALLFQLQGNLLNGHPVVYVTELAGITNPSALQGQTRYAQTYEIHVRGSVV